MATDEKCIWIGGSGTQYTYFIHPLPINFDPDQDGNYIFSKKNENGKWAPIYIGEGDLANRVNDNHHRAACIKRNGATHVHVHLNAVEAHRIAEEQDLLERYTNAYAPNGCNRKEGG
jgi:hypothetical protein